MGQTIIEKIVSRNVGKAVKPGDIVTVHVDRVMIHDIFIPFVAEKFEEMGFTRLWDPDKVVLIYDHLVPASQVDDTRHFRIGNAFVEKYGMKHIHRSDGICHQLMTEALYVKPGDIAFVVEGPVRSLLQTERLMLNIMQRMSGVATMTAKYQEKLRGLNCHVLDTRKTTPGMRILEKQAVAIGGGMNHRIGLFDMILIKDNHVDFAGGIPQAVKSAKDYCKTLGKNLKIEQEVRNTDEIRQALDAGVDRIMLDNFTPAATKEAVDLIRSINPAVEIESSGGITLDTLRAYGEAGVDFISVGALTHSVKGLDLSFKAC